MEDRIDLITTIKKLNSISCELEVMGEGDKADIIDFAIEYLEKYRALLRERRTNEGAEIES